MSQHVPRTRRSRPLIALCAVAVLALGACGGSDDESTGDGGSGSDTKAAAPKTIESGQLKVCSDIPYEPFEFEGDGPGGYTGFDIEVVAAIAEQSDLEVSVSDVEFDGILGNLEADQCDVVASAVTITDERAKEVDFSEPYFDADQSLLAKTDADVADLAALADKTIGVQSGTTGETYAKENTPDGAEVKAFEGADLLFAALESGDVDAILQDFPVNAYRATKDDSVEVVEEYKTEEQYGIAVKKGNASLKKALDDGLASIKEDGAYDTLFEKYFGTKPGG